MNENKFPRGIEVVVGPFIINDKNQILLVKSPKWSEWIVCGGHVDPGETLEDAVKRETFEELGVEIEVVKQINVGEMIVSPPHFKRDAHFIYIDFLARLISDDFKFNEEISEVKWFNIEDAINDDSVRIGIRNTLKKFNSLSLNF